MSTHIHRSAFIALALLLVLFSIQNAHADCWKCPCAHNGVYLTFETELECKTVCPSGPTCYGQSTCDYLASDPSCLPSDHYEFLHCNGEGYGNSTDEYDDFYCIQPDNLCEGQVGGPVNLADGSAWYRPEPDISLNNPFSLEIRHAYWSMASLRDHSSTEPSPLGIRAKAERTPQQKRVPPIELNADAHSSGRLRCQRAFVMITKMLNDIWRPL